MFQKVVIFTIDKILDTNFIKNVHMINYIIQIHNQIIFPSHFGIYYSYPTVYLFRENGDILRWKKICNIDFHGLLTIDL